MTELSSSIAFFTFSASSICKCHVAEATYISGEIYTVEASMIDCCDRLSTTVIDCINCNRLSIAVIGSRDRLSIVVTDCRLLRPVIVRCYRSSIVMINFVHFGAP